MVRLIIVTGSGRSGTSSVAGTLQRFGFHIPQPEVEADERNPRGYYEPLWIAAFHKRWLNDVPVRTIDARPDAGAIAMATVTPERRDTLRDWLAAELAQRADDDVVVIKETRAYWVYPMWLDVAAELGVATSSLTMVRHPTQVVRSRSTAYQQHADDAERTMRETANVAAWMNSVFETELTTRDNPGHRRAFVPYYDLIGDWRAAMTRACAQLDVDPGDLTAPHPVDDFITTSLNRSSDDWAGLAVPDWLRDLAERTWTAANRLVLDPFDAPAMTELEALRAEYVPIYTTATALAFDEITAAVRARSNDLERQDAIRDGRLAKKNATIKELRTELRALRARVGAAGDADGGDAR